MPTSVRVKLNFGDDLVEENIMLAKNAQASGQMSLAYSDFYFGAVVHQYTRQAPSGLHDCLQKSCSGYFATLEVVGRDKDRMEVLQFVEGGDAPFEAQIFTRVESKRGNVTICAMVSKLEVPISLLQALMEFDGSTVNVSLKENLDVPAWLSNHYEPDNYYAVILNHVFNKKGFAIIKLHLLLPNAVRYTVETRLTESFQDQIGLYDVITDTDKKSSFNLYENITFLLRIQYTTDVVAALSFGDGKTLQNVNLSKNISLKDVPEWAVQFTRNSSLCKTFVSHQYTNPGKYAVRLEFPDVPNSDTVLFNETELHVSSFGESFGKVVLITNTSATVNPYDAITFIILVQNVVGKAMAVLKLDEDSAALYTRFTRSTKVDYEGVWYNAVTVTYSFYKPGRHNVTLTIKDGYNSSNQASSVVATEIVVNRIQDAIGEVGLYVDLSKLNFVNTDVEFCLLVQRRFRQMRLHASMGDGHTVDFIKVNVEQRPPSWMKIVPPKLFYLKGVFRHVYSSAGTYLVEVIAEDSLKSRADYSTALIKVVVQDPLSDTLTVRMESDKVSVGTTENIADGTSYSRETDESRFSVSDFTDPSATVLSSYRALTTVETSDSIGVSRDTTQLGYDLATAHQRSTETDADAMKHSRDSSPIGGFAAGGSIELWYTPEITDIIEQPDNDSNFSGMDFAASSTHQLDSSNWKGTDTSKGYGSNFSVAGFTVTSSDQQYSVKGTEASQQSNLEDEVSHKGDVVTRKDEQEILNESKAGETNASTTSGIDQTSIFKGNDTSLERCSDSELLGLDCTVTNTNQQVDLKGVSDTAEERDFTSDFLDKESSTTSIGRHYTAQGTDVTENRRFVTGYSADDYGSTSSNIQFPQTEIDADETSGLIRSISSVHANAATNVSQEYAVSEIITDENAGFPSTLPESDIDPDKATVTIQPNITMAADVGEDYHSTITGDAIGTIVSSTGLYKTTMDEKNILLATSGGENGESQASMNENDTAIDGYTIILNGKYEDTVLHTSQDFIRTLNFSVAETAISKSEEKTETSATTSEDNDYTIKTIKRETVFSEETAEVPLATPSYNEDRKTSEDLYSDEKRTQEIVPDNTHDFNVTTNRELNVAEGPNAYLSSTTDVTPPDSKRTKVLPDENLVTRTVAGGDSDTLVLTLGGTAKDGNTTFATESHTSDNHIYIGEGKYTKNVHTSDDIRATEVNGGRPTQKFTMGKTTVDPDISSEGNVLQSTERFSINERRTIAERTMNVTPDEEKATETYKSTKDKISHVKATSVKKVSDELNFGGKPSTSKAFHRSIKSENVTGSSSLSPGLEKETGLSDGEALSAATTVIKGNVPDKGITPSEISSNGLKQITSGLGKDTNLSETDRRSSDITNITHGLDPKRSTAASKTLSIDFTKLKSSFVSKKGTSFPAVHQTSPNTWKLKSTTSGSGKEMFVGGTSRKPFETTLKDAEVENVSGPHVHHFHIVVYVVSPGIVNFLVLLENVTKNLRGEILFGDSRGENITFDQLTSDFPDWLLERPAKDGNFQQAVTTHVYSDNNSTYGAKITVYDEFGNGFWKTVIFKPQSCAEAESILKVNYKTNETCFHFYVKDSIHLNIHLPFCLLTRSTKSRWIVSRILTQGNDTEYLVKDSFSSPVAYDVLNYTILPFTLEAARYKIEAQVRCKVTMQSVSFLHGIHAFAICAQF